MERFSNLNMLLAFVTVAREGSVSRAAEALNLTQPAVSHQIKRLSDEVGLTLFRRMPTGLQITNDGAALVPKAQMVLNAASDFRRAARQRTGRVSGSLKIGTIVDPEFIRLGRLLNQMRDEYPEIQTELIHGVSGQILSWLKRKQIDAGFYLSSPSEFDHIDAVENDPIHAVKLTDFVYKVIAPAGWDSRIEGADWKTLAALPWIGTPEVSVHHRLLSAVFQEHGCKQNVVALVDQEASMLEMVRSGVGLSLCRDSIALHQKQTFGLAVCNSVSIDACLCFATLEQRKDNPMISALFDLVRGSW